MVHSEARVFIVHGSGDRFRAERVAAAVLGAGCHARIAGYDVVAPTELESYLLREITAADLVVGIASAEALRDTARLVGELTLAARLGRLVCLTLPGLDLAVLPPEVLDGRGAQVDDDTLTPAALAAVTALGTAASADVPQPAPRPGPARRRAPVALAVLALVAAAVAYAAARPRSGTPQRAELASVDGGATGSGAAPTADSDRLPPGGSPPTPPGPTPGGGGPGAGPSSPLGTPSPKPTDPPAPREQCAAEAVAAGGGAIIVGWSGRAGARGCCPAALAPGCEPAGDERDYLVRWSSDGRTWYDAALVRQPSTGGSNIGVQELHAIATHGELLVAAGGSWQRTRGDFAAVAFTSSDGGRTWNWSMCDDGAATTSPRLDCSAGGTGGADSVVDVASDGTSLFATGVAGDSAAFWQARRDPSLPGGLRWSQVAPPADLPSPSRAYAVAPSGGGWVVGVRTGTGAGPFEARLYRYDAGRWSESGRDAGPEYREVSALAVVDRTVVAVGQRGDDAVTWRSDDDGRTWSSTSAAATSGLDWLYNVQARPGGFVAVGTSDGVGLVVTSVDGRSWVPLEPLEAIERAGASEYLVRSVVVLADGARAVATAGGADGSVIVTPLVWR